MKPKTIVRVTDTITTVQNVIIPKGVVGRIVQSRDYAHIVQLEGIVEHLFIGDDEFRAHFEVVKEA